MERMANLLGKQPIERFLSIPMHVYFLFSILTASPHDVSTMRAKYDAVDITTDTSIRAWLFLSH